MRGSALPLGLEAAADQQVRVDDNPLGSGREIADLAHRYEDDPFRLADEEADRPTLVGQEDNLLDVAEMPARRVDPVAHAVPKQVIVRPTGLVFVL
ncbi:MAG TPA: hypothetical protein VMU58_04835 [Gaiellaceae bacterium]|nr:hypothetical protein [Gaiellaceae bacterium]